MVSRSAPKAADAFADAVGHVVRVREAAVDSRSEVVELGREADRSTACKRDVRRVAVLLATVALVEEDCFGIGTHSPAAHVHEEPKKLEVRVV